MVRIKQIIEKFFSQNVDNKTKRLFAEWLSAPVDKELKDSVLMEQWEKECYLSPGDMSKSYTAVEKRSAVQIRNLSGDSFLGYGPEWLLPLVLLWPFS